VDWVIDAAANPSLLAGIQAGFSSRQLVNITWGVVSRYDVPWVIMDSSDAERDFGWRVEMPMERVFEEIAHHAERHPDWLEISAP